jgi:hypothetical protein
VASGEWRVASGEWRVASGEWRVASGEWRVASGEWRVASRESGVGSRESGVGGPGVRGSGVDRGVRIESSNQVQLFENQSLDPMLFCNSCLLSPLPLTSPSSVPRRL